MNSVSKYLISFAGHSPAIADELSEGEQIRLRAMAMSLLIPITIAGVGAAFTVYQLVEQNFLISCLVGLVIAGITLLIDRAFLSSQSNSVGALGIRVLMGSFLSSKCCTLFCLSRVESLRNQPALSPDLNQLKESNHLP